LLWLDSDFATDNTRKEADPMSLPPPERPPILQRRSFDSTHDRLHRHCNSPNVSGMRPKWEGEQRNMWKPTQQDALWSHGGAGQYSIRVNDQLRICFVWTSEGPKDAELTGNH